MLTKTCTVCDTELPATTEYFGKNSTSNTPNKQGLIPTRPECKKCTSKANKDLRKAKKLAGNPLTPPLGTPCDLCSKVHKKPLCFDHDHKTLVHRGWLCQNCNQGLGRLGDSIESIQRALNYVKGNKH
jgi:hypothetical protein